MRNERDITQPSGNPSWPLRTVAAPPPRKPTSCHDLTLAGTTLFAAGDLAARRGIPAARPSNRDVTSFWTWYVLGHCHFGQRRYLEAAGDFAVCAGRDPDFAWVHFNRGLALARAGRLLDARDAYDRAIEIETDFREALVNRAWSSSS